MQEDNKRVNRRRFLTFAGATGAATLAGCVGDDDDDDDDEETTDDDPTDDEPGDDDPGEVDGVRGQYWADRGEPDTREGYLERANLLASQEAAMLFLHQQESVYGKTTRIDWDARVDEAIEADAITPTEGTDVVITQGQLDTGLDPHDHRETTTDNIVIQAYDGLIRRDREGAIVDKLATEWERIEPGQVRFQIREGVTFHNGDELTPDDIAFSINRIVDGDVGDLESPQNDQLAGVESAEVVDGERAVDVFSDGINPAVFQYFASYCDVVQREWIEARGTDELNTEMNGTGPFQLAEYVSDEEVVFESYADHWAGEPPADRVTFRAASESSTRVAQLLEGETDIIVNVPAQDVPRIQEEGTTEVDAVGSTRVIFNQMRHDVEPFSDPMFRRALNYAIDLDQIIDQVLQGFGTPLGQPTLPAFLGYNDEIDPYPQDQALADQLIEQAGYEGEEIVLETPVGRYLGDVDVAQAIAGQVDDLDTISASVEQREFANLAGEVTDGDIETNPNWYLLGWGNATFDASQTLIPLLTTDGAVSSFSNEELDRFIDEAQSMG